MKKRVFHHPLIGDKATFLKTSDDTNGECTVVEVDLVPGGGNTLHIHEFSEKFNVVSGTLSVTVDKTVHQLLPGDTATVPARVPHCFNNKTKAPVKFLVEFRPAQPGFEKTIAIAYGLASDGLVNKHGIPKSIRHLAILFTLGGGIPTGFIRWLVPYFKFIASRSRKTEAELISKYC